MAAPNLKDTPAPPRDVETSKRRLNETFRNMDEQIRNLRRANDNLERNYYTLHNRTYNVAESLGYSSFEMLEEALSDGKDHRIIEYASGDMPESSNKCRSSLKHPCRDSGIMETTSEAIAETKSGDSGELASRFQILSEKYDTLLAAKEKAEEKYKEDYKKWKTFKKWLFDKLKRDELAENKEKELTNASTNRAPLNDSTNVSSVKNLAVLDLVTDVKPHENADALPSRVPKSPTRRSLPYLTPPQRKPSLGFPVVQDEKKEHLSDSKEFVQGCSKTYHEDKEQSPDGSPKIRPGRYTKPKNNDTINATFAVNVSVNEGIGFAFDEVVRGKEKRHRLSAADCDCCKDYYDNVAPIPNAVAPPLWKSPTKLPKTPTKGDGRGQHDHKKRISRHRHQWAPPSTPPDYWSIGFPTTQEVVNINRRAEEMHVNKRRRIEEEARTGNGRYVRKH